MAINIKNNAVVVDRFLRKYFKNQKYSELVPAMKYGTLFGGKKIRSTIILNTAKIFKLAFAKEHILESFLFFSIKVRGPGQNFLYSFKKPGLIKASFFNFFILS